MPRRSSNVSRRAWSLVRLTLLWARKGGVFRRRVMVELRVVPKFLKNIGRDPRRDQIGRYMTERELSFDKTPVVHVRMHRPNSMRFLVPHIPCINPEIDFDYDFNGDDTLDVDEAFEYDDSEARREGEGIDVRAEEFIAKFYEQMKLQRQISYLQYNQQ